MKYHHYHRARCPPCSQILKLIGDQPYIAPTNTTGNFQTHGIAVEQVPKPIRDQMLKDLQAGGAKAPGEQLDQIIESGYTVPFPSQVTPNTPLYKLVDANGEHPTPSPTTPYWVTQKQLDLIIAHPELTNRILALPEANQAHTFNVFKIEPKAGAQPTIWQSQTATSTNPSGLVDVGKSVQTIVPDRSLWTQPSSTGMQIKVK